MISFTVRGLPAPQGSKRAFRNKYSGRIQQVESSKRVAPWRSDVRDAALEAMGQVERLEAYVRPIDPLTGPVRVQLDFRLPRPKGHHGSGRNAGVIRMTAPAFPASLPDLDKLARSTLDALTGIVFADDGQVVELAIAKRYADTEPAGATVTVTALPATREQYLFPPPKED